MQRALCYIDVAGGESYRCGMREEDWLIIIVIAASMFLSAAQLHSRVLSSLKRRPKHLPC